MGCLFLLKQEAQPCLNEKFSCSRKSTVLSYCVGVLPVLVADDVDVAFVVVAFADVAAPDPGVPSIEVVVIVTSLGAFDGVTRFMPKKNT